MDTKRNWSIALAVLVSSAILIGSVSACLLNLPPDPVTMVVYGPPPDYSGGWLDSYFKTVLSNVPPSYDVTDGTYLGWCIDISIIIERDHPYSVILYSSCEPPAGLEGERWDMVNYILNHKQGDLMDIQESIWYFLKQPDGIPEAAWRSGYTPSTAAQAMVNDALANGVGFIPGHCEIVAVICFPMEEPPTQMSIIELHKSYHPKQFTGSGAFGGYTRPEISSGGLSSVVFELHSGPRIWWEVSYYFENNEAFLGEEYDGNGHYFILWDKWGGNLMALPSPPESFNEGDNRVFLENGDNFVIDPREKGPDGYRAYIGAGIALTECSRGSAWITLHTGDQQEKTNPGKGGGSNGKDGRSYDADIRWEIGWLGPDEAAWLKIYVAPGKNPGGKLQFSSSGCYCINTGPRIRVYGDSDYVDFLYAIDKTVQLCVDVEGAEE